MKAGLLRHRVQLLSPTEVRDSEGDITPTFESFATVWAAIEPMSGRELYLAQQVRADLTHKITLRYIPGLTAKCRIQWGLRTFEIGPPLSTMEQGREYITTATEILDALPNPK